MEAADKSLRKKMFKSKKNKQVKKYKKWFTPSLILLKRELGHTFSVTKEPLEDLSLRV